MKDRLAKAAIEAAEADGRLPPGGTVVEYTAGTTGVSLALLLYAASLPSQISQLVPALQNPPLITIHVGLAVLSYGIFATSFAAGVGFLIQGTDDRFAWLPSHKTLDEVA